MVYKAMAGGLGDGAAHAAASRITTFWTSSLNTRWILS
jgi:hypothetical protein